MTQFNVIDIETNGEAPPAEILEIGSCMAVLGGATGNFVVEPEPRAQLYGVVVGMDPVARAVHHISPEDVNNALPCTVDDVRRAAHPQDDDVLVAHNAAFERKWFTPEIIGRRAWICTYKAALRVWPEAPRHTNQVLRYWLAARGEMPELPRDLCEPAHRAGPDTFVTAHLLGALLQRASLDDLVRWADEPRLIPIINFGKHKGSRWGEVPYDYLSWLRFKSDMDDDTKWNAEQEMNLRGARSH